MTRGVSSRRVIEATRARRAAAAAAAAADAAADAARARVGGAMGEMTRGKRGFGVTRARVTHDLVTCARNDARNDARHRVIEATRSRVPPSLPPRLRVLKQPVGGDGR